MSILAHTHGACTYVTLSTPIDENKYISNKKNKMIGEQKVWDTLSVNTTTLLTVFPVSNSSATLRGSLQYSKYIDSNKADLKVLV